ncbi:unnamed protein product [Caenorhabditis nigoni]
MLGLIFLAIAGSQAMPVAGPNYDNIQYLHNFTLTYSNNSLEGMGAIDNATDVNSQMAQSLKSAINLALPGYLASSRNSSGVATSSQGSSGIMGSSTTVPMASSTNMPERQKRQVMATSTTMASAPGLFGDTVASGSSGIQGSSTPSPLGAQGPQGPASTTQPYGTDEEFYARTDLVHFHVDINDLEGSGAI